MTEKRWPSDDSWPVGVLKSNPDELARVLDIEFDDVNDDFDRARFAWLDDAAIGPILLLRYARNPEPGTEVFVDVGVSRNRALEALRRMGFSRSRFSHVVDFPTYAKQLQHAMAASADARSRSSAAV